jgi:hypothetical protein
MKSSIIPIIWYFKKSETRMQKPVCSLKKRLLKYSKKLIMKKINFMVLAIRNDSDSNIVKLRWENYLRETCQRSCKIIEVVKKIEI